MAAWPSKPRRRFLRLKRPLSRHAKAPSYWLAYLRNLRALWAPPIMVPVGREIFPWWPIIRPIVLNIVTAVATPHLFLNISISPMELASVSLILAVALGGCAISPENLGRIDGQPPVADNSKVALLAVGSRKAFPNQIITRWGYSIKEINGKPFPAGKAFAQLDPGEYDLKVACGARFAPSDTGWIQSTSNIKLKVEAGKKYWAWIDTARGNFAINGNVGRGLNDVPIAYNVMSETTSGQCWPRGFSQLNPFADVSGY